MAYNPGLADRIRTRLGRAAGLEEKKMFGGVGFLINGNMACGVHKDELLVRVGAAQTAALLARPHTRPFDLSGKPMAGWILVAAQGWKADADLQGWIKLGVDFARSLPAKQ
jgi:TfoX/Sxy family transcriptional regulator of competence genes